jgi:glyoxylase I family protein
VLIFPTLYCNTAMTLIQLLHATLLVKDLAKAQQFYEGLLGLTPIERSLSFEGRWYQIGAVQLHLIVATQVIDDLIQPERWGRNRHLAFAIADLDAMKQTLETASCPYQLSSSGRAALFVRDPDGNLIELQHCPSENL